MEENMELCVIKIVTQQQIILASQVPRISVDMLFFSLAVCERA